MLNISKQSILSAGLSTFQNDGDSYEQKYGYLVITHFPLCEKMWANLVVPSTNRLIPNVNPIMRIRYRNNVDAIVQNIGSIHYSMFLNLVYANYCLSIRQISFFENFYAHLGSALDLAEEFIIKIYLLFLYIENKKPDILTKLNILQFLLIAYRWYNKNYKNTYEYYLSKGKHPPVHFISRADIIKEYLGNTKQRKSYTKHSQQIRTYRNVIVHNIQIGSFNIGGKYYVPKKEHISKYKSWGKVFSVPPSSPEFVNNFVDRDQQMQNDYNETLNVLNELWEKPLNDFQNYLFTKENTQLLKIYDLAFT